MEQLQWAESNEIQQMRIAHGYGQAGVTQDFLQREGFPPFWMKWLAKVCRRAWVA